MLEIIIMIMVVRMFANTAKDKKLNGILWGFIGAASFYVPVIINSIFILPELVYAGIIPANSELQLKFTFILINIIVGALCCTLAYQILKRQKSNDQGQDQLLDNQSI
jgi:hypothetical protein